MIEWGVSFGSHDAAIAVFDDDNLIFASDAERWSKKKNDNNIPENLISYCEQNWGIPKKVYYYENPYVKATRRLYAGQSPSLKLPKFKYDLKYTNHHLSHASYGYYTSPFNDCVILVIDAIGEWDTMSLWEGKNNKIKRKKFGWKYPKSLGLMYSAMTQAAGWKPNEEEYIMMGASAIRSSTLQYQELYDDISEKFNSGFNFHTGIDFKIMWDKYDIAGAAQNLYEFEFNKIVDEIINMYKEPPNIVFLGGCALNVSGNILLSKFPNVYIPPNPGDGGSAIGCVLSRKNKHYNLSPFLGYNIEGEYPVNDIVQNLLLKGVVGIAKGKAEFGPRALGNRSLLADPRINNIKTIINNLKGRESFRPFGAMILKEDLERYFYSNSVSSPYMNCVYKLKNHTSISYPSICHIDETCRLQIIDESQNDLYRLMQTWKKATNCPMIINTSLNIKGQPIINDEDDVIKFSNQYNITVL